MSAFVEEMRDLRLAITEARALTATANEVLTRAERRLECAIEQAFKVPFNCIAPASDHRRADHTPYLCRNREGCGPDFPACAPRRQERYSCLVDKEPKPV